MRPGEAFRLVEKFLVRSPVTVYYNPQNVTDSLLLPGFTSGHLFMIFLTTPFNLAMLGGWLLAWDWVHSGRRESLPRCAKISRTYDGLSLNVFRVTPLAAAMIGLLAVSFTAIFAVGILSLLMPAAAPLAATCLCAVAVPASLFNRQQRAAKVLVVDELRGRYELHDAALRRPHRTGSLGELRCVVIREHVKHDSMDRGRNRAR